MNSAGRILVLFGVLLPSAVWGQMQAISVNAAVCEKIINGESRASARVRATDKASFKAVEDLPDLSSYRTKLDTHGFNLKVYRLVDNYLENVKISTVSQDNGQICVEVSAELPATAVAEVFETNGEPEPEAIPDITEAEEMVLELEDEVDENVSIAIPPKPEIVINKEISYAEDKEVRPLSPQPAAETPEKTIVFIDKTRFYNGSDTSGFFSALEQVVLQKRGFKAAAVLNSPDYILKTKVLKAKVDNVNSETSRLQIVAALELIDTKTSAVQTEHQNRFVLFNSSDDAQKVAANLTRKLLSAGAEKLLSKAKGDAGQDKNGAVITPN